MTAAATDLFTYVGEPGTATTLAAPGYTAGGTSINVGSTTNFGTTTAVVFAIDEVETVGGEEVRVAGTYNTYLGIVSSGTQLTSVDWLSGDGDRDYAAGSGTRVYITTASAWANRLIDGLLVSHNQDGTLKDGAVDNAAVLASDVVTTAKILDSNVTTAKLADANVTTAKLDWTSFKRAFSTMPTGTTTSTSTTNTSNTGGTMPSFTFTVDVTGYYEIGTMRQLVWNSGANDTRVHYAVSGATTVAARELIQHNGTAGTRLSNYDIVQLTAGSNTITFYCSAGAGTGNFSGGTAYYRQV